MWRKRRLQKKRFGRWVKIFWIIPFLLLIALAYLFFKSGLFNIKQVEVQVNQLSCTDESQIRNSANLAGQNFFLMNSQKVESNLKKKFYCIKSIILNRRFPDQVKLEAFSREPVALLASLKEKEASVSSLLSTATPSAQPVQDFFKVDSEGVVFAKDTEGANLPRIYLYDPGISLGKKLEDDLMGKCLRILEKVKQLSIEVNESWISSEFFIINSETSKMKVIFRLDNGVDIQLASLQLILDKAKIDLKELEFIDLRFDKPVVKFAPKKISLWQKTELFAE